MMPDPRFRKVDPPTQRPNLGIFRVMPGDIIVTADLMNMIISALLDVSTNLTAEKQRHCGTVAQNLIKTLGDQNGG